VLLGFRSRTISLARDLRTDRWYAAWKRCHHSWQHYSRNLFANYPHRLLGMFIVRNFQILSLISLLQIAAGRLLHLMSNLGDCKTERNNRDRILRKKVRSLQALYCNSINQVFTIDCCRDDYSWHSRLVRCGEQLHDQVRAKIVRKTRINICFNHFSALSLNADLNLSWSLDSDSRRTWHCGSSCGSSRTLSYIERTAA
jgi:hypothetical protein